MKKISLFASLTLLLFTQATGYAQNRTDSTMTSTSSSGSTRNRSYEGEYKMNTWSVTVTPALTRFFGDLDNYGIYKGLPEKGPRIKTTGALGVSINKQLTHLFGASANFHFGSVMGSKQDLYNAYFRSDFLQGTLTANVNLKSLLMGTRKLKRWKWDVYGGAGLMWFDTRVYSLSTGNMIRYSNDRRDYSSVTQGRWEGNGSVYTREIVFPVGTAIHYELTPRLDIGLDLGYNMVNTEKLDMTVGGVDNSNPANVFGWKRGTSAPDKWASLGLAVTYKIGKNAIRVGKDGVYDATKGRYHLRWADPKDLIKEPYNPTMNDADSIAKANMPKPVDPRLYTDSDNDGVADLFDKEANTPAGSVVSGAGVAMNLDSIISSILRSKFAPECEALFSNIEFDTDKATIRPASQDVLRKVIELLNLKTNCGLILVGHADYRASYGYNVQLSRRRVDATKRFLTRAGLTDPSRVTVEYYGEYRPLAPNTSSDNLQRNRRVEIKIVPMNMLRSPYQSGQRFDGRWPK
ncbi:OmpA family protein [Larkinella soli]|uniref:OmpA family protein n=1 Tax=Larkinella soli TaxID=1770527 RepID=UPI001E586E80|nr:OmpA family protein [Larkinella soli]